MTGGTGPWEVALICCGYDEGTWRCPTWADADALRESYCTGPATRQHGESTSVAGHERVGIIQLAPAEKPAAGPGGGK